MQASRAIAPPLAPQRTLPFRESTLRASYAPLPRQEGIDPGAEPTVVTSGPTSQSRVALMHPHGADRHARERRVAQAAGDARVEHAGEPRSEERRVGKECPSL